MRTYAKYIKRAKELGAIEAKVIPVKSIIAAEWVRLKCKFGCSGLRPVPDLPALFTHTGGDPPGIGLL
jgi:predicted metal-binding protein